MKKETVKKENRCNREMQSLKINRNDAGQRLDKFLNKAVKGLPMSLMYKYIRTKKIKVNRGRTQPNYVLCEGDEILLTLEIPDGLCFRCTALTTVTIGDGVQTIGDFAFSDCSKLTSVTIPASVQRIGEFSFNSCKTLTIHAPAGSKAERYAKANGIRFEAI